MKPMTDMKLSRRDKKKMFGSLVGAPAAADTPDYPWGLTLNLEAAALKKLGVDELPDVGEECMLRATGKVTRVSESASEKKTDRSVDIQITKLVLVCEEDEMAKGFATADKE